MVPVFGSAAAWGAGCHDADAAVEGGDVEGQGERLAHWRPFTEAGRALAEHGGADGVPPAHTPGSKKIIQLNRAQPPPTLGLPVTESSGFKLEPPVPSASVGLGPAAPWTARAAGCRQ